MNLTDLMNLSNVEMSLILVEGTVLLSLFTTLIYFKHTTTRWMGKRHSFLDSGQPKKWVRESEMICQDLSRNLEEKREITERLIAQLDERIKTLQTMLKNIGGKNLFLNPVMEKDLEVQIYKMSQAGHDVSNIAQQLQISMGEVQLALDLNHYRQSMTQMKP